MSKMSSRLYKKHLVWLDLYGNFVKKFLNLEQSTVHGKAHYADDF